MESKISTTFSQNHTLINSSSEKLVWNILKPSKTARTLMKTIQNHYTSDKNMFPSCIPLATNTFTNVKVSPTRPSADLCDGSQYEHWSWLRRHPAIFNRFQMGRCLFLVAVLTVLNDMDMVLFLVFVGGWTVFIEAEAALWGKKRHRTRSCSKRRSSCRRRCARLSPSLRSASTSESKRFCRSSKTWEAVEEWRNIQDELEVTFLGKVRPVTFSMSL